MSGARRSRTVSTGVSALRRATYAASGALSIVVVLCSAGRIVGGTYGIFNKGDDVDRREAGGAPCRRALLRLAGPRGRRSRCARTAPDFGGFATRGGAAWRTGSVPLRLVG